MRWFPFILLAGCMLILQSAVAPRFEVLGTRPDWLLVVVVFLALQARPSDAFLGAWILGAMADLLTIERLGFLAISYGLAAIGVASIREALFRNRGFTRFAVTLLVGLMVQTVWCVYRRVQYAPAEPLVVDVAVTVALGSLHTALWAPLFGVVLSPLARALGLPRSRYSHAGLSRLGDAGV